MGLSPLEYASMLCESFKRSKTLIPEYKVDELVEELQAVFPDLSEKIARMYIVSQNKAIKKSKRRRKRKRKTKTKSKIVFTEEELKVKAIVNQWVDDFDREYCAITHPVTLAVKVDMELNIGVEEAFAIIRKIDEECGGLYDK